MKRYIRSNTTASTIFEDEYFDFVRRYGVGMNNIPWEAFLFVVDQDIILLLYYKYIRKTSTPHHKKTFNT